MRQNIDLFNEYVAIILIQLYGSFPLKQTVTAHQISSHRVEHDVVSEPLPRGKYPRETEIAADTIAWLVDNGYVHTDSWTRFYFYGCALTKSGLELLNSIPDSLQEPEETFGERLIRLVGEGSMDAAKVMVTRLLTLEIG